jgi:hypothetical protein
MRLKSGSGTSLFLQQVLDSLDFVILRSQSVTMLAGRVEGDAGMNVDAFSGSSARPDEEAREGEGLLGGLRLPSSEALQDAAGASVMK